MSATHAGIFNQRLNRVLWAVALALAVGLFFVRDLIPWAVDYPAEWVVPLKFWVSDFMKWLIHEADLYFFTFKEFTRGIASVFNLFLDISFGVLSKGEKLPLMTGSFFQIPPLSWIALIIILVIIAYSVIGCALSPLVGASFFYLARFG